MSENTGAILVNEDEVVENIKENTIRRDRHLFPSRSQEAKAPEVIYMRRSYGISYKCQNEECGKDFLSYRADKITYCNVICANRAIGLKARGRPGISRRDSSNGNWKGGISKNHYHYKRLQLERYPERIKAREVVRDAVRSGKLIRPDTCPACGFAGKIFAHHRDYGKPLEIEWLCRPCHRKEHDGKH